MDIRDLPSAESHAIVPSAPTHEAIKAALQGLAHALSQIVGADPVSIAGGGDPYRGLPVVKGRQSTQAPTIPRELGERILDAVESGGQLRLSPAEHVALTGALRARRLRVRLDLLGVRLEHTAGHSPEDYARAQEYCGAPDGQRLTPDEVRRSTS